MNAKTIILAAGLTFVVWLGLKAMSRQESSAVPEKTFESAMLIPNLELASRSAEMARLNADRKDATIATGVEYTQELENLKAAEEAARADGISDWRIDAAKKKGIERARAFRKWLDDPSSGPSPE